MKRVIAILTPVPEQAAVAPASPSASDTEHSRSQESAEEPRATRIEVVVSDQQADRILLAVLGSEPAREAGPTTDSLDEAILNELRETDASSVNLLEQIVSRVERKVIEAVYSRCDRNKSRAAVHLGINRNTLLKKLRQFGCVTDDENAAELIESH